MPFDAYNHEPTRKEARGECLFSPCGAQRLMMFLIFASKICLTPEKNFDNRCVLDR